MSENKLLTYRTLITQLVPRWLRAGLTTHAGLAGKILYAIGVQLDTMLDALVLGVKARFPGLGGYYDSLGALGADRRISRGPSETDAGYAARLLPWLDAHRGRGGPYALMAQMRGYWLSAFPMALVYRTGARFSQDTSGNVTRDTISTWTDTGMATWTLAIRWTPTLTNDGLWGDPGVWGDGGIWGSSIDPATVAQLVQVPTEWNTADAAGRVTLLPPAQWADTSTWQQPGLVSIPIY